MGIGIIDLLRSCYSNRAFHSWSCGTRKKKIAYQTLINNLLREYMQKEGLGS